MKNFSEERKGTIYAILAFIFWGLVPIYFKMVQSVNPIEILIHRIVWSVVFLTILVILTKQISILKSIFNDKKKLKILFITSFLVSSNWLIFIWAVTNDKITEASLGYYINPIVNVILGIIFFKEKPTKFQNIAIFFATLAILNEVISFGSIPLVSISLALTFGFYGMFRKKISLPSMAGLFIETLIVLPFALGYFAFLLYNHENSFIFPLDYISMLLICAGLITVIPLLWFNAAATRVSLIKLGFLQYFGPTIAFLLGIFVYHEPFGTEKLLTFTFIWIALLFFTFDSGYQNLKKNS